jgi:uncharacterized membrane protein
MSFDDVLRFTNVFFSGLVAGILLAVVVGMVPIIQEVAAPTGLDIKQRLDVYVDRVNPLFALLALLAGIFVLVLADDLSTIERAFQIAGVVGSAGVGVMTAVGNRPINKRMSGWSRTSPPPELAAVMARWSRLHAVRTLLGVVAFGSYLVATIAAID